MNVDEITPETLAADEQRRAYLKADAERIAAEIRAIDDRAAAWRVHRLAALMSRHAEQEAHERAAREAARARAARPKITAPEHWLDKIERDREPPEREQEAAP